MPALDALQAKLGSAQFDVVAVNIDTRDPDKPKNWLKDAGITTLGYFSDEKARVFQELKAIGRAIGMPTSVLIDANGCEIGHHGRPGRMDQRRRRRADQGRARGRASEELNVAALAARPLILRSLRSKRLEGRGPYRCASASWFETVLRASSPRGTDSSQLRASSLRP